MKPIKVLLVDDQALIREGLKSLLALNEEIIVVGEACDGKDALSKLKDTQADVMLLDIRMPEMSGIELLKYLCEEKIHIPTIILTTFDDHELVLEGMRYGAKGYLLKDISLESLVNAIQTVNRGETLVQPALTERLLKGLSDQSTKFESLELPDPLTPKETEILRLMAGGYSNKEISKALSKSEGTVKNHVSNILSKLGVRDRTRAVLKSIELGIL